LHNSGSLICTQGRMQNDVNALQTAGTYVYRKTNLAPGGGHMSGGAGRRSAVFVTKQRSEEHAGGGYTKNNVARCWTYETAVLVDEDEGLPDDIPRSDITHEYYDYFAPDHRLNVRQKIEISNIN